MVPEGWREVKLGDLFASSKEKGKSGLPIMSVTLKDGLVPRDSLERKTDTNLSPKDHLRLRKGYIAYNMMRMWQGASGVSQEDGLVSPAYVVLVPKREIDPTFASYFFKAARTVYLFWAYSYGLTNDRLRLYYPDFAAIPVAIPPFDEQRKIGEILATWDKALGASDKLIQNSRRQQEALVHRLLSGSLRLPAYRSRDWTSLPLSSIAELSSERFDPQTSSASKRCIELEHIESRTGARTGECDSADQDSKKAVFRPGDVLFGKLRPYLRKYYQPNFEGVCSTEIWVLKSKCSLQPGYLYYLVQTDTFSRAANVSSGSKMPRADWSVVRDTRFKIPDADEQRAIVSTLGAADALVHQHQQQRRLLLRQKNALMQQLLTGKRRVKVDGDVDRIVSEAAHG